MLSNDPPITSLLRRPMTASSIHRFRVLSVLLCIWGSLVVVYLWLPHFANHEIRRQIRDFIVMRPGAAENSYGQLR